MHRIVKYLFYIISFIIITFIQSCQNPENDLAEVTAEQFIDAESEGEYILLDVRTNQEFKGGHIMNAILLDVYTEGAGDRIDQLDKEKVYYVYCQSGIRSRSVVNYMRNSGFRHAYNIRGGIFELRRKGVKLVQ